MWLLIIPLIGAGVVFHFSLTRHWSLSKQIIGYSLMIMLSAILYRGSP